MKHTVCMILVLLLFVGVGYSQSLTDPSAAMQVSSTTKGFLPPQMTEAQRDAIPSPAAGLVVYNTTTNKLNNYDGTQWVVAGTQTPTFLIDDDGDTQIQVEESGDEDKIRFDTAGTERMIIDDSGNVGIGTASPTEKLHIRDGNMRIDAVNISTPMELQFGTNAKIATYYYGVGGNQMEFHTASVQGSTASQARMVIDNGEGHVGIGTNSPTQKLHIDGSMRVEDHIYDSNNEVGTTGQVLSSTASGTDWVGLGSITTFADGDGDTQIQVEESSDEDIIRFDTAGTERMIIDDSGNVGIDTTSPDNKLEIGDVDNHLGYGLAIENSEWGLVVNNVTGISTTASKSAAFQVAADDKGSLFRINNSGNVGIGTTTPQQTLDVNGSIRSNRTVYNVAEMSPQISTASSHTITIRTQIKWQGGASSAGSAGQMRVRSYGYQNGPSMDFILEWYNYHGYFLTPGNVTAFHAAIGSQAPQTVRMGTWDDNGTRKIAIEVASEKSGYWSSYTVDLYRHGSISVEETDGWIIDNSGFAASVTNIVTVPQEGPVVQTSNGNVGIGTTTPTTNLEVVGNVKARNTTVSATADLTGASLYFVRSSGGDSYIQKEDNGSLRFQIGSPLKDVMILLKSTGNVGIGTLVPSQRLHVNGNVKITGTIVDTGNSGGNVGDVLRRTSSGIDWQSTSTPSDKRIKKDIKDYRKGLSEIMQIRPVSYQYNEKSPYENPSGQPMVGIIAQEIQKVLPSTVSEMKTEHFEDLLSYDSSELLYTLINAVKELNGKVQALSTENDALKARVDKLEKE